MKNNNSSEETKEKGYTVGGYKFKTKDNITKDEFKKVFNMKLLNVIMNLENQELLLKKS